MRAMRRPRTHAFWVMAFAMGLVVLLRLLAHAWPADPSWIAGLDDDADLDDVIQHALSSGAVAPAAPNGPAGGGAQLVGIDHVPSGAEFGNGPTGIGKE